MLVLDTIGGGGAPGGGGGGALPGMLTEELEGLGIGDGRLGSPFVIFAADVDRRFAILDAGRIFSETLLGIGGAAPVGRRGLKFEDPDNGGGGGGGVRPRGADMGGFPDPIIVEGRLGGSIELIRGLGRGVSSDIVDVGRSAS